MITAGIVAGSGIALGVLLVVHGLMPRRQPLADVLAGLLDPAPTSVRPGEDDRQVLWRSQASRRLASILGTMGIDVRAHEADLHVVGRTLEQHLVEKLAATVAGVAFPVGLAVLGRLGGMVVPLGPVAVGALALGVAGFVVPDVLLRGQAEQRRRDFRYALSSYLDLTHVVLAAGAGVETALAYAAEAGEGWAFAELRAVLHRSRLAGDSPWAALERLGRQLDVPELREVGTSLALAGTHGAKVRASLEARSAALRSRDLAEMEGNAEAATERMAVPSVLMVVGFVIFVGYPAVIAILGF